MSGVTYAKKYGVLPSCWYEDTDEFWDAILSNPVPGTKEGSCLRGAIFLKDATAACQHNVGAMYSMLFDIDDWPGGVPIFDTQQIADLLGFRCIIWTTYNSTRESPRYRLVIPLEEQVSPNRYYDLFKKVNLKLGNLGGVEQNNLDRLGYLPRLRDESARADYSYQIFDGPRLNGERDFGPLEYSEIRGNYEPSKEIGKPDQKEWVGLYDRIERARLYFKNVGTETQPGGRHKELFKVGCKLWWDFWLDEESVRTILGEINARFPQPKPIFEVVRETEASFTRTRGRARVEQPTKWGSRVLQRKILSKGEIKEVARKLKRRNSLVDRELGDQLQNLAAEGDVASGFDRGAIFQRLARLLATYYPTHDSASIANHFNGSLVESERIDPGAPTLEDIERRVIERQDELKKDKEVEDRAKNDELSRRRRMAFGSERVKTLYRRRDR